LTELAQFLTTHSHGRLGLGHAEKLQQYAKGTFGISLAVDAFALEIKLLLAQIEFIEEQIQTIEEAIQLALEDYRAEFPCDRLPANYRHVIETVPGLGPVLTAAIIGEVGDIGRFANARKLVAYAGLDATTRESGQFVGSRNHLSKRGSPHLRRALWLAAISARRFNPELRAYYEEKKAQGKHSMVATGAVARRLVHMIYSVWSQNRPFDPNYRWAPHGSND
jgi:transposase